jgi:hypothetical protein
MQNDILDKISAPLDPQHLQIPVLQRRGIHDFEIVAGEVDGPVRVTHERTLLSDFQPIIPAYKTEVPTRQRKRDLRDTPSGPIYKDNLLDHQQKKDLHQALRPTIPKHLASATQPKKSILDYQKSIPTYEIPIHSLQQKKDPGDITSHTQKIGIHFPYYFVYTNS